VIPIPTFLKSSIAEAKEKIKEILENQQRIYKPILARILRLPKEVVRDAIADLRKLGFLIEQGRFLELALAIPEVPAIQEMPTIQEMPAIQEMQVVPVISGDYFANSIQKLQEKIVKIVETEKIEKEKLEKQIHSSFFHIALDGLVESGMIQICGGIVMMPVDGSFDITTKKELKKTDSKLFHLPIWKLVEHPSNVSLLPSLSEEEENSLRKSIESGVDPIPFVVVPGKDNSYIVLDGNNRLKILQDMNYTDYVPCIVKDLSNEEQEEYIIKNQLSRRNLTMEQKKEIARKLISMGKKVVDVAGDLGVSAGFVSTHTKDVQETIQESRKNTNRELRSLRVSDAERAKQLNVSESTIRNWDKQDRKEQEADLKKARDSYKPIESDQPEASDQPVEKQQYDVPEEKIYPDESSKIIAEKDKEIAELKAIIKSKQALIDSFMSSPEYDQYRKRKYGKLNFPSHENADNTDVIKALSAYPSSI